MSKTKRSLATVLVLVIIMGMLSGAASGLVIDPALSSIVGNATGSGAALEITTLSTNPAEAVSRGIFVQNINQAFRFTVRGELNFNDIEEEAWYVDDIAYAVGAGYLLGYGGGANAEETITRQQAAVIAYRVLDRLELLGGNVNDVAVPDIDDASPWAKKEIEILAGLGVLKLGNDGFRPLGALTRSDAADLIANMLALAASQQKELTIMFTSDVHGAFGGLNYATNVEHQGLSRVATEILSRKANLDAQGKEYLIIDIGDTIQGAGTTGFINNSDYVYPLIKAFNYLGYDAVIPGNHEFNFGIPAGLAAYNGTQGGVGGFDGVKLCGNMFLGSFTNDASVTGNDPLLPGFKAYEIFEMDGIKVALIGMTNPGSDNWDAVKLQEAGYYTESVIGAAKRAIEEIKAGELADIIILAAHMSTFDSFDRIGSGAISVLADSYIAENVDVFLGAHGHTRTSRVINGVRYGENSANGSSVGIVSINVTNVDGKWTVVDKGNSGVFMTIQQISFEGERNAVEANVRAENAAYLAHMKPEIDFAIAYSEIEIGKLINGDMIGASPLGEGMNIAYTEPTKLVEFIHDVQLYYGEADLSIACPFSMFVQHREGPMSRGSLIGIYNYDSNTIYRVEMKGWQVKKFLEYVARTQFTAPDVDNDLSITHLPSYRTDSVAGLRYTIDLTKPEDDRVTITEARRNGVWEAFDPDATYIVAANDFRTSSGIMSRGSGILSPEDLDRDDAPKILQLDCNRGRPIAPDILSLLVDYIQNVNNGVIDAEDFESNWEIVPWWDADLRAEGERLIAEGKIADDDLPTPAKPLTVEVVEAALAAELAAAA
ncbi:MAG: 5'-nucleotidase C-terminal domain-containing protein [Oscillospiraceae bacterium]|nr:5'-nucleotidase C-terminal domain-containing protein [Oscillospiraceae bacterium]